MQKTYLYLMVCVITFFSFFLNTFQRSTVYLSRAKGKKYRTSEASTGDFLPGE